jgi:hypothetical protein
MRRNNRGALWALGLAGATYLWQNRAKLQQQVQGWQSRRNQPPRQIPDFGGDRRQEQPERNENWGQPSRGSFGGTEL